MGVLILPPTHFRFDSDTEGTKAHNALGYAFRCRRKGEALKPILSRANFLGFQKEVKLFL